jgi:hypothetical protein
MPEVSAAHITLHSVSSLDLVPFCAAVVLVSFAVLYLVPCGHTEVAGT